MNQKPIEPLPENEPLGEIAAAQIVRFFVESLAILLTDAAKSGAAIDYLKMCREHVLETWPISLQEKATSILDTVIN